MIWSKVKAANKVLGHFMSMSATSLTETLISFSSGNFVLAYSANTSNWFSDRDIAVLDWWAWPEPNKESTGYYQEKVDNSQSN